METTVAAYQPHYFPRLHYLARAQQADVFVVYDDVEFSRRSRQHRAPIDYHDKNWLTIPVRHTDADVRIDEVRIDMSTSWPVDHLKTLRGKYGAEAGELEPFYEQLCITPVGIGTLREHRDDVTRYVKPELVDECLRLDDKLRTRRRESRLQALREQKNRLAQQIADQKRADSNADVDKLLMQSETVKQKLTTAETACCQLRTQRNRMLVRIAKLLDKSTDFNDEVTDLDRLPMAHLWEIEGVAPEELMADVKLVDLTIPLLLDLFQRFEIESTIVRSSNLPVDHPGDPSEYLAQLTDHFDGNRYITGKVGYENYLDETPFHDRGQEITVQDWDPTWENGNVCALDVLYNADNPGSLPTL